MDYICLCIFLISVCITGKCSGKFGSSGFAIGTLAVIGKLNLAALNGYAVIGQTAGNFYGTKQVFRIICIIRVSQLACQRIQNTVQFCAVFGIYFAAVGYHVDSRILFRIADDDITGSIICGSRAIIVMFIEYSSMTTVIIDINICFIILENQACISFAAAAAELVDMGNAVIFVILRCGKCRQLAQADAIGQGEVNATPLQIANLAATIANRGYFVTPHIVSHIEGSRIDSLYRTRRYTMVEHRYYDYVVAGMRKAVLDGTCTSANLPGIEVCGKTGTAQNRGQDHSAFIGFAPMNNPKIAIAVYVENGGFGAHFGVPIGAVMIEQYLNGKLSPRGQAMAEEFRNKHLFYGNSER